MQQVWRQTPGCQELYTLSQGENTKLDRLVFSEHIEKSEQAITIGNGFAIELGKHCRYSKDRSLSCLVKNGRRVTSWNQKPKADDRSRLRGLELLNNY